MSLDDWILALHVLSGFAMASTLVLYWVLIVAMRDIDSASETLSYGRLATAGNRVVIAGSVGTLVFGLWLAISRPEYQPWDGWVIAAIVLWLASGFTGARAGAEYTKPLTRAEELVAANQEGAPGELRALNRSSSGLVMHTLSSILIVLLLAVMIWKPGA
jgi:uncharacterized membrane protein